VDGAEGHERVMVAVDVEIEEADVGARFVLPIVRVTVGFEVTEDASNCIPAILGRLSCVGSVRSAAMRERQHSGALRRNNSREQVLDEALYSVETLDNCSHRDSGGIRLL